MNNVILTGRLTKDVETKYTQDEKAVARFTIAVQRDKDSADFINCVAFGKTAENLATYTQKGYMVGVIGEIRTGSYEKNGQKVFTTDIIANRVEFLQTKEKAKEEASQGRYFTEVPQFKEIEEDIPF